MSNLRQAGSVPWMVSDANFRVTSAFIFALFFKANSVFPAHFQTSCNTHAADFNPPARARNM